VKNLLPQWLFEIISNCYLLDYITEIRIRIAKPIMICYRGNYEMLCKKNGFASEHIIATQDLISYILAVATKQSFYAYNNQIKQGFITTDSGIRIGLCGTAVIDSEKVTTIKNISSLNIRISHSVKGCSAKIIDLISFNGIVKNTLIISPPAAGKTTIIRDIIEKLSNEKNIQNIMVVDERFEIAGDVFNSNLLEARFVDILSGTSKSYGFKEGIKTMNPTVIIADEICDDRDFEQIIEAAKSGVKIIASAHSDSITDLKTKPSMQKIMQQKIFDRIIVLSKRHGAGTIEGVFDENLKGLYFPIRLWNIVF